jgi:hypothetical protein
LENLGVVGSILLKWVSRKYIDEAWTRFIWLRAWNSTIILYEHDSESHTAAVAV